MIRPALTEIALFLAPFVAYAIFLIATRAGLFDPQSWPLRILIWLVGIGFVLMIVSFLFLAHFSGIPIGGSTYIPAHIEDGKFVPGQWK
jgi:hypothetical protein